MAASSAGEAEPRGAVDLHGACSGVRDRPTVEREAPLAAGTSVTGQRRTARTVGRVRDGRPRAAVVRPSLHPMELRTQRLVLRRWQPADREPFAALNADPVVMEHFVAPLTRDQSDALVDRIEAAFEDDGWGLWAAEVPGVADCIGFIGLATPDFEAPFTPCVEVGWRLAKEHWGRGYAPEGATEALRFAFDDLGLDEVVSFTSVGNAKSRRVMEKIGMSHESADDFDHPRVPAGHRISHHVLYRIRSTVS